MYRVTIYNGDEATVIHEPTVRPEDPHLYAGTLVQGSSGEIDSLTMKLLPNNPGYELLSSRTTLVQVLDTSTDEAIFTGRVLTITPQMEDSGLIYKTVVCEDRLGYLCDSIQPYTPEATYYGDDESSGVEKFLALLLENHNAQVEDYKKIYFGDISYTTSSNNCTKGLNYETTWEAITSKLLTDLGGEIRLKEGVDGLLYLDYVPELGETVDDVTIELGKNMTSISQEIDPTSIITRLIPLGARLESDDGEADTDERVTIASVNDGCIWIDDTDAQAIYGIVAGTVEWEDVTEPANLLTKAQAWLAAQIRTDKISLTALDLSLIGLQPDAIRRYNRYQVVNAAIGLDASIRVLKRTVNLCDPTDVSYEMGERSSSITSTVNSSGQQVKQLHTSIINVTAIANGKTTSYYADETPEGTGYTVNDIWFDTSNGYAMYYWNGSEWVKAQYGTNAIADGVITSNLIASEAITAGEIASGAITTDKLATGAITAEKISVSELSSLGATIGGWKIDSSRIYHSGTQQSTNVQEDDDSASGTTTDSSSTYTVLRGNNIGTLDSVLLAGGVTSLDSLTGGKFWLRHNGDMKLQHLTTAKTILSAGRIASGTSVSTLDGSAGVVLDPAGFIALKHNANPFIRFYPYNLASNDDAPTLLGRVDDSGPSFQFNGALLASGDVKIGNTYGFYGRDTDGTLTLVGMVSDENRVLLGATTRPTYIRGTSINLTSLTCTGNGAFSGSLSTYGYTVPRILRGGESLTTTATSGTVEVTFSTAFPGTPTVVVSPQHSSTTTITARVYSKSSTGFKIYYTISTAGGTVVFNWIAMYS